MVSFNLRAALVLACTLGTSRAQTQEKVAPRPNGTYAVGLTTFQVVDHNAVELFVSNQAPRALEISVFFPAAENSTTNLPYFPPETARVLDTEHSQVFQLDVTNGTFEQLYMTVATNGTSIAPGRWPTLLFSGAEGTTRLMYNSIAAHVSSNGYVVITIDTPYDTDVVQFSNGTIDLFNQTLDSAPDSELEVLAVQDVNGRSTDATFLLDYFSKNSSAIPGCEACLNLTHAGYFGHSIGGATATTVQLNESRIAGSVNYDGAIWGDVVQKGLDRPYMLLTNESRASQNETENSSWGLIWPNLRGPKFNMILADAEHYTFSDLPVIVETLDLSPSVKSMALEQITNLNGDRALNIVVSYTVAFFDFVLRGQNSSLLQGPSSLFPEISFDNSTGGSATSPSTTSGARNVQPDGRVWALFLTAVGVFTALLIN